MSKASEPFSSAVHHPNRSSPRGAQPPELPLCGNQRRILPTPVLEKLQLSKRGARHVPKQKQGEVLLPPGFEQGPMSKRGRMELDNPAEFERFGYFFQDFESGTPLRAQQRASTPEQPVGVLRRGTYKSFDTQGSSQALCRSEDGLAVSHPNLVELQGFRSAASFIETKASFMGMWIRLDETLQNHDSVLVKMKEEIEKSSVDLKTAKDVALKEREELEAASPDALKALETVSEQAKKAKRVREDFEHLSTDLSVQLAELNRIQQQVQEQQANLEALIKFKTRNEAQEKSRNVEFETGSLKRNLQEFEARLAALEAELSVNKLASEQLEQAVMKGIAGLKQFDEVSDSQQGWIP